MPTTAYLDKACTYLQYAPVLLCTTLLNADGESIYSQIKNREFSHQKLINEIAKTLKGYLLANTVYDKRIDIEVYMLVYYNSYLEHEDKLKDLNSFEVMNDFKIKSNFDNSNTQDTFKRRVESEINHFHRSRISIDYLINKIDLMEPLKDYSNE